MQQNDITSIPINLGDGFFELSNKLEKASLLQILNKEMRCMDKAGMIRGRIPVACI
jgi:hypothetical protein